MGTESDGQAVTIADGRYELESLVGVGGMGEVWSARDGRLARPVVVKLLREQLAGDRAVRRRFETEARAAARLGHPNVVAVFDTGEHEGRPYIVMERLAGPTLAEELRAGPMPVRAAMDMAADVLAGLSAAHAAGIVHRDVKPANVIRCERGTWKVVDFGIAKAAGVDQTGPGAVYGTPSYLAPEILAGGVSTSASDVYSVGVLLYEALTGAPAPPPGAARGPSLASARPEVPTAVVAAVDRARSPDPAARFVDAAAMSAALGVSATGAVAAVEAPPVAASTQVLPVAPAAPAGARRLRPGNALLAVAVALFVALIVTAALIGPGGSEDAPTPPVTVADTATVPPPPPDEDGEKDDEKDEDGEKDDDENGKDRGKRGRD